MSHGSHWSKLKALDEDTGIKLPGVPDLIFRKNTDSFGIVAQKTAKLPEAQEALKPMYQVQLGAYAWIEGRCGFWPVSMIGVVIISWRIRARTGSTWVSESNHLGSPKPEALSRCFGRIGYS